MDRLKKGEWVVRSIDLVTAHGLIQSFHYAKSAGNTAVYTHGLFRKGEDLFDFNCQGVAWWLPPTKAAAVATYPEGDWQKVLSLSRLVIRPDVPKNACSFLLAKSIALIDHTAWECLVTYADTWQGHTGAIYKATNWEYLGLTKAQPVFVNGRGKMMGRKRGPTNLSREQMALEGFTVKGSFAKHKFRMLIH